MSVRERASRLLAVGALTLACTGCVPPPPPDRAEADLEALADLDLPEAAADSVLRRAQEVTVRIRALGCDRLGLGSGFVVSEGVVVTNRHVVDEPREITMNTWDGRSLDADVQGIAVDSDLAVLSLEGSAGGVDLPTAELRTAPPEVGEPVVAVGYPGGGPATVTAGRVVGLTDADVLGEPAGVVVVDAEIRQGNSGGPLLDEQGRVVGVVFAVDLATGFGLAVPVATLLERLGSDAFAAPTGAC